MKKVNFSLALILVVMLFATTEGFTQTNIGNVVNVTTLRMKNVEGGSAVKRDSIIAIYNEKVTKKNEYVLSHREYRHFYTPDNTDYFIMEEYKDMSSMEKAATRYEELEKLAWPDEAQRKAFLDGMNAYFEMWHGDAIYSTNPKLSKN
jgi:hypothetical protein